MVTPSLARQPDAQLLDAHLHAQLHITTVPLVSNLVASRTSDKAVLPQCEHFLLYLNASTWTRGANESAKLARDVMLARKLGVHVLLAHEQPNVADGLDAHSVTLGVPFDAFFNNHEGTTPRQLLVGGIYDEIAVPLKRGPYRPVSMALLAKAVATKPKDVAMLVKKGGMSVSDLLSLDDEKAEEEVIPETPFSPSHLRRKMKEAFGRDKWDKKSAMEEFGVPRNPVPAGLSSIIGDEPDPDEGRAHVDSDPLSQLGEHLATVLPFSPGRNRDRTTSRRGFRATPSHASPRWSVGR